MIKLLVFINRFECGGVSVVTETFLRDIDYDLFDVEFYIHNGVIGHEIHPRLKVSFCDDVFSRYEIINNIMKSAGYFRRRRRSNLIKAILRNDIVLASGNYSEVILRAKKEQKKTAIWLHGVSAVGENPGGDRISALHAADYVFCVSEGLVKYLKERWCGINAGKLYNPLSIDLIKSKSLDLEVLVDGDYIVSVGRLSVEKDYETLLRAYSIAQKMLVSIPSLFIIGDGKERVNLEELSKTLNIDGKVIFAGEMANPYPWIAAAKCLVLSSVTEGLPTVLLEALSLKTPVISTDCPHGPREILNNEDCGLLAPMRNPEALAQKLVQMLSDEELRETLAERGFARALEFDTKLSMQKWQEALLTLASGNNLNSL